MTALVAQYHDRLSIASAHVTSTRVVPLAAPKAFLPQDSRFLSGEGGLPLADPAIPATASAGAQTPMHPLRKRVLADIGAKAKPQTPPPQLGDGAVTIDDDDDVAVVPEPSSTPKSLATKRPNVAATQPKAAKDFQPVVLAENTFECVVETYMAGTTCVAKALSGKRARRTGEVDPVYIMVTHIPCGNQVHGDKPSVASEHTHESRFVRKDVLRFLLISF